MVDPAEYQQFLGDLRSIRTLAYVRNLLDWDEQVNMPTGAATGRGEQAAILAQLLHEKRTAPAFVELVQRLNENKSLSADAAVNVRETWRDVERAKKIPADLVVAMAQAESRAFNAWIEARAANSFQLVQGALKDLLALKREYADHLAGGGNRYDALLDLYEPGLTATYTNSIFAKLGPALKTLLDKIVAKVGTAEMANPARALLDRQKQREFNRRVAESIGFDFSRGRIDEAVHPFCNDVGFSDVRLTTRYHDDDVLPAMYGTLHEAGHGLYEQGYLAEHRGTPLSEFCSMAIHESQSRIWENHVGRSREFVQFILPRLQKEFPAAYGDITWETFYRYANRVRPSLIRVEADEVSYGLHVIIRFELEQEIFNGKLEVDDLSEAWNAKYLQHLGISSETQLHGVLQDVHWYGGNFGYFPTYLLGTAYAAQLYASIEKNIADFPKHVAAGQTTAMKEWLNKNIHRHGKRYEAKALIAQATGEAPNADYLIHYLNKKFGELYQLA